MKISMVVYCSCKNIIFTNTIYYKISLYFIVDFNSIR